MREQYLLTENSLLLWEMEEELRREVALPLGKTRQPDTAGPTTNSVEVQFPFDAVLKYVDECGGHMVIMHVMVMC